MAFTFVVEDGTGLAGATSYVSVAEADDYYVIDLNYAATWAAFTQQQKEYRLAWSTRVLDQKTAWRGDKANETQGLRIPRSGMYDWDDVLVADNVVPKQVKHAVLELQKFLAETDLTTEQGIEYVRRMEIDVLEIEFQDNTAQVAVPRIINDILAGLGTFKVGGNRFPRILKV